MFYNPPEDFEEIDRIISDIQAYRRKENMTELKNSARELAALFEVEKL